MKSLPEPVHVSLGAYGRLPFDLAISMAVGKPPSDPLLGKLSTRHLQLCPQNTGILNPDVARTLRQHYPDITWRLHANIRTALHTKRIDLCDWPNEKPYFRDVAAVSHALNAPVYSAHAGRRIVASTDEVIRSSLDMAEHFGMPVAIEGHYPTPGNHFLFSTWEEYRQLLESGAYFALDLSHLNILACQSGIKETNLVKEMLACNRCLEVHVSSNDGTKDQHLPLHEPPWWWPLLTHAHEQAVVFSEGRIAYQ